MRPMSLTDLTRSRVLSDGQVVTLLVALGLEVLHHARRGACAGSIHPAHVDLDRSGRPCLRPSDPPPGWQPADDVMALLRLGVALADARGTLVESLRDRAVRGDQTLPAVLPWLMTLAAPKPLLHP